MKSNKLTDAQKIKAIAFLLEECSRHNDWTEVKLLHIVEEIINDEVDNDAPDALNKLITEAEHN